MYSGGEDNWLGPFLGGKFPSFFALFFGKVGFVFLTVFLVLVGLWILVPMFRGRFSRFVWGSGLLAFNFSFLLSLRSYGLINLSDERLSSDGGVVGQFFCQYIAIPVFGGISCVVPLVILLVCLLLILGVCFGLRPRHFHFVMPFAQWVWGWFKKRKDDDSEAPKNPSKSSDLPDHRGVSMMDDETIYKLPDDYRIRKKGKVTPFSSRKDWLNGDGLTEVPKEVQTFTLPHGEEPVAECFDETCGEREDPEIIRLRRYLKENMNTLSAKDELDIRNKIEEINRAKDMLKWQNSKEAAPLVKGNVRRTSPVSVVPDQDEDKTVVADQASMDPSEIWSESLLGGDGAQVDEPLESEPFDDEFVPEEVALGHGDDKPFKSKQPPKDPTHHYDPYVIPSVDSILSQHEPQTADYTEEELHAIGSMLEEKLENFKVKGRVVGIETGPIITRFEIEPGPGVKVNSFSALQEDLALALKVRSIRILAPIPGQGAVGIEIPNRKFQIIYGRDIFESEAFSPSPDKIMVAIGKDITGEPFAMDLAKAPHLMIAGQTGSGKSVCINSLMASLLFSKTPDELRLILVDPKAVELKMYENIPHLLAPVITKPEMAIQALEWLCYEMDRRTEVLAAAKVRNLLGFNQKFQAGELPMEVPEEDRSKPMAFIVVVIDEMADLMAAAGKDIEKHVSRLAAKARAVGIHLVLATQRPSVKVITGNIKANLPTRISFKVASQVDARTIMDHAGAEKLLGRGDMLFKAVNEPEPIRVHGAFLSDEEAEKLADACSNQNVYYPQLESFDVAGGENGEDGENGIVGKLDDKLAEVLEWCIEVNGVSTSAIQRHFSVGYSRAGKIVDQMEKLDLIGRPTGNSKPRAVRVTMEEFRQMERSGAFR
ncbi:MAG: DNA translocase FtsK [Fibrobacteraceae bacterium]|nr:DNA translocase FtsK [Fibrobacteraceae bacterium]